MLVWHAGTRSHTVCNRLGDVTNTVSTRWAVGFETLDTRLEHVGGWLTGAHVQFWRCWWFSHTVFTRSRYTSRCDCDFTHHLVHQPRGHGHEWPTHIYFVQNQFALPFLRYDCLIIWHWKSQAKSWASSKLKWRHLRPIIQSIQSSLFSWQSDICIIRYNELIIWPWKFKVKVVAKVEPDGHIWGLDFIQHVWFSFCGNSTIFGWDIANSTIDHENSRSRSRQTSTKF